MNPWARPRSFPTFFPLQPRHDGGDRLEITVSGQPAADLSLSIRQMKAAHAGGLLQEGWAGGGMGYWDEAGRLSTR